MTHTESSVEHRTVALRPPAPVSDRIAVPRPREETKARPRRRRHLVAAALGALALGVAAWLAWSSMLRPLTVPVAPVEANLPEQVFGLGTVGARVLSDVGFKVAGVLVALTADQGERVRAGQVLARLDAHDIAAQLAVATAGVAQAHATIEKAHADAVSAAANLANAKAVAARRAALVKSGFATVEETQTTDAAARVAAANLAAAQSGVAVAEAALKSAEAQETFGEATLANYALRAPYDAWVVSRNLELGSAANPGQSVFTLVEAHTVWVKAYIDERLAGRLKIGQPAEIILRSQPGKRLPGHIARIEIQSDPVNEERLVDVAFDDIPSAIHLAEQAEAVITTGTLAQAVAVRQTAVADLDHGRGMVWTVENGRLARREVRFGPELLDGRLPILADLPEGAAVVAAPVTGLRVGRAAQIAAQTTKVPPR